MKFKILFLSVFIAIFHFGCQQDKQVKAKDVKKETATTTSPTSNSETKELSRLDVIKNMKKVNANQTKIMRDQAISILEHRHKESDNKAYIALDKDLWEYELIFSGKEMSKMGFLTGSWIDFNQDLTYTYGYYDEVEGKGRYVYSIETGLLLLLDDNKNYKPQEFEANLSDYTLIMDGNSTYRDNNYNGKLKRVEAIPTK